MEDHFFEDETNNHQDVFQQEPNQESQQQAAGGDHFDNFFGDQSQGQAQQTQPQHQEEDDFFGGGQPAQQATTFEQNTQSQYGAFNNNFGSSSQPQQNYDMFDPAEHTPQQISEHEERKLKLQKDEQERTQKLIQKQSEENTLKSQRISAAKTYLANWKSEREQNIQKRKQACLQEEEVLVESRKQQTYKNSWDKITSNISLKASEYPGAKDVTRMKESILNKKSDLANN
ncbi:hypothetical protein ABPG74_021281 [Tetrahymena malaccensis]